MNGNIELLNYTYQNSQMGVDTVNQLMDITDDEDFKNQLRDQAQEYEAINQRCKALLHHMGADEKGIGTYNRVKTYLMINIQTITDDSPSHIAEMLIIGSNMGMIQALRNLRKYTGADDKILAITRRLLAHEEDNIQKLKAYL